MSEKRFELKIPDAPPLIPKPLEEYIKRLEEGNEQLKEERDYFERKKCEYFNKYNKKHLDNIQLQKENEQLRKFVNYWQKKYEEGTETFVSEKLNKLSDENTKLHKKVDEQQDTIERLQEKVTDYEIILSITNDKRTLCKEQQINDVAFYCERYSDYRCYPLCPNTKDCFKADGTFQEKLKDLKEFWGEKWK